MSNKTITPEQGGELKRLFVALAVAYTRAAAALQTDGRPLEAAALERLMEEDGKAAAIVRRIKEIQGK
jgi:hypothetical protein